jgi:hypothetical protein
MDVILLMEIDMGNYACRDRMCGAEDCNTCYPGNHYGEICEDCDENYEDCQCEEFKPHDCRDDYEEEVITEFGFENSVVRKVVLKNEAEQTVLNMVEQKDFTLSYHTLGFCIYHVDARGMPELQRSFLLRDKNWHAA